MIPDFDEHENLKPGIWPASIHELAGRFAGTDHRERLFKALVRLLEILRSAGCSEVYLNGSFITAAAEPADYDLCYEPTGMHPTEELKELLEMTIDERKKVHLGDIFIRLACPPFFIDYVEFWQTDREDNVKGIIRIDLRQPTND